MHGVPRSRFIPLLLTGVLIALAVALAPSGAAAQSNPTVLENLQPGTNEWQIPWGFAGNDTNAQIKGYASAPSVNKGESITFYISVNPAQTYTIDVYRLGWYQGLGGRLMAHVGPLNGVKQATCPMNATTGMIECQWTASYTLATQTSWTSGIYLARLTNAQNMQNYIVFAVRDDARVADLVYQQPVTTYQAYNNYPNDNSTGKSLYEFNSFGANTASGNKSAVKVSFDRPYGGNGSGEDLLSWETPFIRWIEKMGYDVTYITNLETHTKDAAWLRRYRGFLSVGHDEYWSKPMYDNIEGARDTGLNLGWFGADNVYWQIRFEASSTNVPNRVVVCYRYADLDPNTDPALETILWRDPPVNRPEQKLFGTMFIAMVPWAPVTMYAPHVVINASNWVYAGTGFQNGNSVTGIVGYEADQYFSNFPSPTAVAGTYTLLSDSPFQGGRGNAAVYQAPSGAWVFATGSMAWNWALDNITEANLLDTRIQKATQNVLDRFVSGASQAGFSIGASPTSQTVLPGASGTYNVTITPNGGFNGQVTFSVANGLPAGATATFAPNPATSTSVMTVTTAAGTPSGTYLLQINGVNGGNTVTATVAMNVPGITVTSPNSAVTWNVGSVQAISFTHNLGVGATVNIDISRDAGGSWNPLTTLTTTSATSGSFTWTVTSPATNQARIRATWTSGGPVSDISDVNFTISASTQITIGETNISTNEDGSNANLLIGQQATLPQTATIQTLSFYVKNAAGNLRLGIYDASGPGGGPGVKKAESNSFAPVLGWNTVDVFPQIALPPGTYWLAWLASSNSLNFTRIDNGQARYYTFTFGTMPTTFSTNPTTCDCHWSMYATLSTGSADTNPPSMPTGLSATPFSSSRIDLAWTASTDDIGVAGYNILRNGAQVGTSPTTSFSDTGLSGSTTYTYSVVAFDGAGNTSPASTPPVPATTPAPSFDFSLSNGGAKSVVRGSSIDNPVTATLVSGATEPVTFTTSGLPADATASYSQPSCSPTCTTTITIATTASTPLATSTITVTGTSGSLVKTTTFNLTVTAAGDTTPPTVTMGATPANGSTIRATVTLSATASDNVGVVGVQFLLDGNPVGAEDTTSAYSISFNTTTATTGPHTLSARARDAAGNTATATVVNVTIDNLAPTGTVVINGGAAGTNSRNSTLTLAATDNVGAVSQMRFSNTGTSFSAAEAYATTKAWQLSSGAGTKTVYVQFRDAVGNWSTAAITDTIVYDTTAPTISAVSASGVTNGSATINWTTSEPATSQVEYGPTTSYGTLTPVDNTLVTVHAVTLTGLNPQTLYNYRVRSLDIANNQRIGSNATFTTLAGPPDTTPPTMPGNLTATAVSASQINLTWTASTDNVAVTGYRVFRNGTQIATVSVLSYSSTGLTPSTTYTYTVAAQDAQNNVSAQSAPANATTQPDTTAPTVSITSPTGGTVFGTITITANASDNVAVAGVTFRVDGADIGTEDTSSPYSVSLNTATLSDGGHTLTAVARDTSSLTTTSAPVSITVNNTAPPMMVRYVNTASTVGGDGTTNNTTGATRAFKSLLDAVNSLPDVLTMPTVIYLDGAGGPDTTPVDQQPFDMVTSASNYLLITTNAANRAKVPIDPARYTLMATNSNALYNNIPSHIRFDGIQVQLTVSSGSAIAIKTSNANEVATDIDARISNSVVKCVVSGTGNAIGFNTRFPAAGAGGNVYVWNNVAYGCSTGFNNDYPGAKYVNNTAFNNDFGYVEDANGSMKLINCLAAKGSKSGSVGFVGTFATGSDYNAEDDGNGAPGTHSRSGRTFTFVNAGISDVHLSATDTGAKDFGTGNPLPGIFADDIDGILRSGLWDIGADESGG